MLAELLLVEDDQPCAARYRRVLEERTAVHHVASLQEARASSPDRWNAVVVDVGLPDGDGMDYLSELRGAGWSGSALVVTGRGVGDVLERAQALCAFLLTKPAPIDGLRSFARWACFQAAQDRRLSRVLEESVERMRLTSRETDVLRLSVSGVPRAELSHRMAVAENTVKTHVRGLLKKAHATNLSSLVGRIYRNVHET